MKENIIQEKSYDFAKSIVYLYKDLKERKEFELGSQILRSGTSIGANIEEAIGGQSRKDFIHKLSIAYKEARETRFWLRLLSDTNYISRQTSENYLSNCEEILRILASIQKTVRSNS